MHHSSSSPAPGAILGVVVLLLTGCAGTASEGLWTAAPAARAAGDGRGFAKSDATLDAAAPAEEGLYALGAESSAPGTASDGPRAGSGDRDDGDVAGVDPADRSRRLVIYTGRFALLVPGVDDAIGRFLELTESLGGFLQSRSEDRVVVRVPARRFRDVVEALPELGEIQSRNVEALDVTRQHQDLELRLSTARAALERLTALLARAEAVEDILAIEKEIHRLTETVERLEAELRGLNDRVAYSTITVTFRSQAPEIRPIRRGALSRYGWINRMGVEHILEGILSMTPDTPRSLQAWLALLPFLVGCLSVPTPDGFLVLKRGVDEVRAVSSDDARYWVQEFDDPIQGDLEFWAEVLEKDLIEKKGYVLLGKEDVTDVAGRKGRELLMEVTLGGIPYRYLVTLFVAPGWHENTIRTSRYVAPKRLFDAHLASVRRSSRS